MAADTLGLQTEQALKNPLAYAVLGMPIDIGLIVVFNSGHFLLLRFF